MKTLLPCPIANRLQRARQGSRLAPCQRTDLEAYDSAAPANELWLSIDAQHLRHPPYTAYNAEHGPVRTYTLRLHAKF